VTIKDLEIFRAEKSLNVLNTIFSLDSKSSSNNSEGSLFALLNKCKTPFGKRCLKDWIMQPLIDVVEIKKRQSVVTWILKSSQENDIAHFVSKLKSLLNLLIDSEKLLASLHHKRISPAKLSQIFHCINKISEFYQVCCDKNIYESFPTYLKDLTNSCENKDLITEASILSRSLQLSCSPTDDLTCCFTNIFESNYSNIIDLRKKIQSAEVGTYFSIEYD